MMMCVCVCVWAWGGCEIRYVLNGVEFHARTGKGFDSMLNDCIKSKEKENIPFTLLEPFNENKILKID